MSQDQDVVINNVTPTADEAGLTFSVVHFSNGLSKVLPYHDQHHRLVGCPQAQFLENVRQLEAGSYAMQFCPFCGSALHITSQRDVYCYNVECTPFWERTLRHQLGLLDVSPACSQRTQYAFATSFPYGYLKNLFDVLPFLQPGDADEIRQKLRSAPLLTQLSLLRIPAALLEDLQFELIHHRSLNDLVGRVMKTWVITPSHMPPSDGIAAVITSAVFVNAGFVQRLCALLASPA